MVSDAKSCHPSTTHSASVQIFNRLGRNIRTPSLLPRYSIHATRRQKSDRREDEGQIGKALVQQSNGQQGNESMRERGAERTIAIGQRQRDKEVRVKGQE